MTLFDWIILVTFLAGVLLWSAWLGRGQKSDRDYYLAGNQPPWWAVGLSTLATQCSTNSLLGGPAFVAFAAGGGLVFLQWELAVPVAMVILLLFVFPALRAAGVISIYEFLERRFGLAARTTVSVLFQFFRAFATGVTIYGVSLLLAFILNVPFWAAVVLFAGLTVVYDFLGGMRAVIWTDVAQFVILFGGIALALAELVRSVGGWSAVPSLVSPERLQALQWHGHGWGDGQTYTLLPMLVGGLFLYVSYYGLDQTQAQRVLSCRNSRETTWAIGLNGLLRMPLALTYALVGVLLAAYAAVHPSFLQELPVRPGTDQPDYNMSLPIFVIRHLPAGIVGLIVVGLFAAAMSSLDSTLNSLSATTAEDLIGRFGLFGHEPSKPLSAWTGRFVTLFWGVACTVFAFFVGGISDSIIITINKIGSVSYGPVLGIFALALWTKHTGQTAALTGLAAGYACNMTLWLWFDPAVSWLWWSFTGAAVCVGVALLVQSLRPRTVRLQRVAPAIESTDTHRPVVVVLMIWTGLVAAIIAGVHGWLGK